MHKIVSYCLTYLPQNYKLLSIHANKITNSMIFYISPAQNLK